MRIAFYSLYGCDLIFAARLQDEGHDVLLYNHGDRKEGASERLAGEGLVPTTTNRMKWIEWGKQDKNTVFVFGGSSQGVLADTLRRSGALVIGAGSIADKLEEKRPFAQSLATKLGIRVPPAQTFSNIADARAAAQRATHPQVFKTDKYLKASATYVSDSPEDMVRYLIGLEKEFGRGGTCTLQDKIPGIAISTAWWFNGVSFIDGVEGTLEHKKFMNDDLGGNTGCSFNVVWIYKDMPKIAEALQWRALEAYLRQVHAPPGLYDINALISEEDGEAYFLEFTPRFGYDSEPTAQRLVTDDLGEFYYDLATGRVTESPFRRDRIAYSVRISVPPYPIETPEAMKFRGVGAAVGYPIGGTDGLWDGFFGAYNVSESKEGQLQVSSPTGLIGIALTASTGLSTAHAEVMTYLQSTLKVHDLQYRTDGLDCLTKDLKKLADLGYAVREVKQ